MRQGEQLVVNFPPVPAARLSIVFPRDHHHQTTLSGASWLQSTNRTSFRSKQRNFAFEKQDTNCISIWSGSARPICQQQRNVNRRELLYLHNRCVCSAYLGKHRLTLSLLRDYVGIPVCEQVVRVSVSRKGSNSCNKMQATAWTYPHPVNYLKQALISDQQLLRRISFYALY